MTSFVTGARGPIGREISRHLEMSGWQTVRFSRNADPLHQPISALENCLAAVRPDVVFHLAWSTFPATAELEPGSEWMADLPFVARLCGAIARLDAVSRPLLVFMSTGAIYGETCAQPKGEGDTPCPKGWYARSKLAAEALLDGFAASRDLPVTIIRASSVYGFPQDPSRLQGIVHKMVASAIHGSPCTIWGDGSAKKDFLHVRDLLTFVDLVLSRRSTGTFNVCTGTPVSLNDLARTIEEVTGRNVPIKYGSGVGWDVHQTSMSYAKAFSVLGWRASISLENGMAEMAAKEAADHQA